MGCFSLIRCPAEQRAWLKSLGSHTASVLSRKSLDSRGRPTQARRRKPRKTGACDRPRRTKTNGPPVQLRGPFVANCQGDRSNSSPVLRSGRSTAAAARGGTARGAARRGSAASVAAARAATLVAAVLVAAVLTAAAVAAAVARIAAAGGSSATAARGLGSGTRGSSAGRSGAARSAAAVAGVAAAVATTVTVVLTAAAVAGVAAARGRGTAGRGRTARRLATTRPVVAERFRVGGNRHDEQPSNEQRRGQNTGLHGRNS